MKSLSALFRIGPGPSSSHTIAPYNAASSFVRLVGRENADSAVVTFYGSLALTAVGHHSDRAVINAFGDWKTEVKLNVDTVPEHPLTMVFEAFKDGVSVKKATYISLGGGEVKSPDDAAINEHDIYPFRSFKEIERELLRDKLSIPEFCLRYEVPGISDYLMEVVKTMFESIERGLHSEGMIPANKNPKLQIRRVAKEIYERSESASQYEAGTMVLTAYAYAVNECSACGEVVVTAPTCGSCGVLPAVLYTEHMFLGRSLEQIRDALFVAGLFGNIVKQNASIAGSIGGCQAEIGTATSMAAAAVAYLHNLSLYQIEYAAETAMEHFLGLSCDPVDGYVIIPCIERNSVGAVRAFNCCLTAKNIAPIHRNQVSFDDVVSAMKLTGDALSVAYKETAEGGLAQILKDRSGE